MLPRRFNIAEMSNVQQAKLADVLVLALMCWQVSLKMTVQTRYYQFLVRNVFIHGKLPERSRFNRICRNAGQLLQLIRFGLVNDRANQPTYTIIDSLPLPLCDPIRNHRAKALKDYADIGYNATKKRYYYGFKGSFEVTNDGTILTYTISQASVHDIHLVSSLIKQASCDQILADVGYLSAGLKQDLALKHINFWTPVRKNMAQP